MVRRFGLLILALGLAIPVTAAEKPAAISGYVRSAEGAPQMGAMVEVLGSAVHTLKVFTDANGFYSASGLIPGVYNVRVSALSFLPALREGVGLRAGASAVVNITLNTLFESFQIAPARGPGDDDDWKWVLRSASNRPILRVVNPDPSVVASAEKDNHDLTGTLSFLAGSASDGFGSTSDMSTGFSLEKSIFSSGTVGLRGNVGYGSGEPTAVVRASYTHKMANGSEPQVAFTMLRLASPDINLRNAGLQALSLTTSDQFRVGDVLELTFGNEMQTIQFMGRMNAIRPFASADLHLSPNTLLEYRYASAEPDSAMDKGFDSAATDVGEAGPQVSIAGFTPAVERARHQELSLSRRVGKTNLQVAVYSDHISDPALTGVGYVSAVGGNVLPDLYSGTFTYQGSEVNAHGVRLVMQRKLTSDITATLDYGYGGVLDLAKSDATLEDARESMVMQNRHSLSGKVSGKVPGAKSSWIVSYQWMSGQGLTPVDGFNASAGQADPYLNIFFRQPIPGTSFLTGHMDALIDVRNLLAQGYVPVLGQDGRTVYLVQSARAIRGGVAFTF
jgi:hypothetical protein